MLTDRGQSPSTSLSLHSDIYPDGLPSDYSVIATFKTNKETARRSWDLWQVSDLQGQEQVGLRFQDNNRSLDFFYVSPRGGHMLRTFSGVEKLFDGDWHKLALSVKGSQAKLLIDCVEVSVESLDEPRPVVRRGYTSIAKRAVGDHSVSVCRQLLSSNFFFFSVDLSVEDLCLVSLQVDLQQMELSCDPEKVYSEECCELSGVVSLLPPEHTFVLMRIYSMCLFIHPLSSFWNCGSVEGTLRSA